MSKYMSLLIIAGIVPFICSFWPGLKFYRNLRALAISIGLIVIIFGGWDVFATWRGHWSFNASGVWPIRIVNLPIEEVLFFVVIPFCCIFTWEAILYLEKRLRK
ncbi:MAG: lycopene cyclase domain-containing protein [Candidatus Omnitrophica bacterium]|nr:lycopene cyclase domain-containing protein [Candidatus Omnitrophota bacterium]MBU1869113.1 lycopene cyclase domain-containing protein [Candidatus Omnitrophota bacterium]